MYATCGKGWGLGGRGTGDGDGSGKAPVVDAGPRRCSILVAAEGIQVDGVTMTRADAVTKCKDTTGADVIVTGDAREGDWTALETALRAAKIEIYQRAPKAR